MIFDIVGQLKIWTEKGISLFDRKNTVARQIFDAEWYLKNNPNLAQSNMDPYAHFSKIGWIEGQSPCFLFDTKWFSRKYAAYLDSKTNPLDYFVKNCLSQNLDPHPLFNTAKYLAHNSDVRNARANPLLHYLKHGQKEGRECSPLFDAYWYRAQYEQTEYFEGGDLKHYLETGWKIGKTPHPLFDSNWYLKQNEDVNAASIDPLVHYIKHGDSEGRNPNPYFDVIWYKFEYNDSKSWDTTCLEHYISIGADKKYKTSPWFDGNWYLDANADVCAAKVNPLSHFLTHGQSEGRHPNPMRMFGQFGSSAVAKHFQQVLNLAALEHSHAETTGNSDTDQPLISFVVPVYNASEKYLDALLGSFITQPKNNCELIFSDDGSTNTETLNWLAGVSAVSNVKVLINDQNRGIAATTNSGIASAAGEWIALLDHDDMIAPYAISQISKAIHSAPQAKFIYTDELIVDEDGAALEYFLKPAWDPVLLSGTNYVNHFSIYNRERLLKIGAMQEGFQGSQDYDLLLRYTEELARNQIVHIPYPAYIWRRDGNTLSVRSINSATRNARRALKEHYARLGSKVEVKEALTQYSHRVVFPNSGSDWPLVSVVIPSRNSYTHIERVLSGLYRNTEYPNFEIIIVDNGSDDQKVLELYKVYSKEHSNFQVDLFNAPFNFATSINRGVKLAKGSHYLLLNNDIEVVEKEWLKEMVMCFHYQGVGIVGSKLLYPDQTIQHMGVIVGLGGLAGHWYVGSQHDFPGPMGRFYVRQSVSAVTGACLLISKSCFEEAGGMNEQKFAVAYNDIDLCLNAVRQGYEIILTPFSSLIHHESASRGSDETESNRPRFDMEKANLQELHDTGNFNDRAYNPWYSKNHSNPSPTYLKTLPLSR